MTRSALTDTDGGSTNDNAGHASDGLLVKTLLDELRDDAGGAHTNALRVALGIESGGQTSGPPSGASAPADGALENFQRALEVTEDEIDAVRDDIATLDRTDNALEARLDRLERRFDDVEDAIVMLDERTQTLESRMDDARAWRESLEDAL